MSIERLCLCCNQPNPRRHRHCQECHTKYVRERREINREQQTINFFKNLSFWVSRAEAPQA